MVSAVFLHGHPHGVYGPAKGRVEEIATNCRLRHAPGASLTAFLFIHKLSNISIGVVCFASLGFFTSIFEPLIMHKKFSPIEMLLALITIAGLVCIFSFDSRYRLGIAVGILSAAVCSLYAITNKKVGVGIKARTVLLYEMAGGLLGVSLLIPIYLHVLPSDQPVMVLPEGANLWWLLCLSLFCTVGLYLLQIIVLRKLPAFQW